LVTTAVAQRNLVEAIRDALFLEMERDDRVVVLGMDVGALGGVFRATDGLQKRFGESRVVDTPLAEGAIVGASLGLSVAGLVPVAEIQFLGFLHFAFHQLGPQLGRLRFRSRGRYSAPVTIRAPYGGGTRMPEFHADAIEGQLANCPGLKIVVPSTPHDAKGLLLSAIRDPDPVIFIEHQRLYRNVRGDVPDGDYTVPIGKAALRREGTDITLVSLGAAVG
jgi:pyruvate dehydrogenase E1 component beta subunit